MKYIPVDENDVGAFLIMVGNFLRPNLLKSKVTFNLQGKNFEMWYETPPANVATTSIQLLYTAIKSGYINCLLFKSIETGEHIVMPITLDLMDHHDVNDLLLDLSIE